MESNERQIIINQIDELNTQAYNARNKQLSQLLGLSSKALSLAKEIDYIEGVLRSLHLIGTYYSLKRNTQECIRICSEIDDTVNGNKEYEKYTAYSKKLVGIEKVYLKEYEASFALLNDALEIFERIGLVEEVFTMQYLIANSWNVVGNYSKALDFLHSALDSAKNAHNKFAQTEVLSSIIEITIQSKAFEKAKRLLFDVITIQKELGLQEKHAASLIRLGIIYDINKDHSVALEYYLQALEILRSIPKEDQTGNVFIFEVCCYIGAIYIQYEDNAKADLYYNEAADYADWFDSFAVKAKISLSFSHLRFKQNNKIEAVRYAKESLQYFEKIDNIHSKIHIYENACIVFEQLEDYKRCYEFSKKLIDLVNKRAEGFQEAKMMEFDSKLKSLDLEQQLNAEKIKNQYLLQLETEKNDYIGMVAHDLKNPISNITLLSKLLQSQAPTIKEDEIVDIANDLIETSERMFELVNNLLDINIIESGEVHLHETSIDINSLLKTIINHNTLTATTKGVTLQFTSTVSNNFLSDEGRLYQILENLLSNSIKYTKPNTLVSITTELFELKLADSTQKAPMLRIIFEDQGQGIPKEEIPNLFKKFAKVSTTPTAGEHSTGLGLSIVKKIVEQLHGNVYCESSVGIGSKFIVEFPFNPS
jgi:signal transduction histidine kinase